MNHRAWSHRVVNNQADDNDVRIVVSAFTVRTSHPLNHSPSAVPPGSRQFERLQLDMLHRYAAVAGLCMLVPLGLSPLALADPPADPPAVPVADNALPPPPPGGPPARPSGAPGVLKTPDGWVLECVGQGRVDGPVAP